MTDRAKGTLGVVGLGYVGLPLALEMAHAGYTVLGLDVSERVVSGINKGQSHILDVPQKALAEFVSAGVISATTDMSRLAEPDLISICVPTPLNKTRDPDVSYLIAVGEALARTLRKGQIIILESTTYPGTTKELLLPMLEATGLKVGVDFYLLFSPERVDPGNPDWHTRNTPKVIGGVTAACLEKGSAIYGRVFDTLVTVTSTDAAELVKLLENTFRMINIGLVNEMQIVCDKLGVNVNEVIDAAATKPFGFMKFTPGPGLGGHCIPVDPHYLSWKMRTLNYRTRFVELASEVNAEMPNYWVQRVQDALNSAGKAIKGSRVLVLGVAYKRDIDDIRESPAIDIIHLLLEKGAQVAYHDPFVPEIKDDGHATPMTGVALSDDELKLADCVLVVTDHAGVDYARVSTLATVVVDTRNVPALRGVRF